MLTFILSPFLSSLNQPACHCWILPSAHFNRVNLEILNTNETYRCQWYTHHGTLTVSRIVLGAFQIHSMTLISLQFFDYQLRYMFYYRAKISRSA